MKGGKHNDGLSSFADIETETARSKGHGRSQEASLSVSHPGITGSAHCMRGTAADPTSSRDFDFWLDRVPHLCRSLRFRDALFLNNQDRK
jgi:hypothetical protein